MSEAPKDRPDPKKQRKERLAAALRANLRRRKAQVRARRPDDEATEAENDEDSPSGR